MSQTQKPADLSLGSFSHNPPWVLSTDELAWQRSAAILRKNQALTLQSQLKKPLFPPARRAVGVALRFGAPIALWAATKRKGKDPKAALYKSLRKNAERLGPTFIKLAQIISAGEGVFPPALVDECKKCRDQVPAVPSEQIRAIIEEQCKQPLNQLFSSFDDTPIAAASIAQVHNATLLDGTDVVVKVQRPGIDKQVRKDLKVLSWLAPFLIGRIKVSALANPPALVELFAETIIEELDFRLEAQNMLDVAAVFVALKQKDFVVPRPHPTLVTQKVLMMEKLEGYSFNDVAGIKESGLDTHKIINTQMLGFLEGAFLHGVFHGDLHGGNLFVLPDGKTGLVDFGITGRLTKKERMAFLKMMMTATSNDPSGQVEALRDLGALPADTDVAAVVKDLGLDKPPIDPTQLEPEELVKEMQTMVKALLGYGARVPKPLMLYMKNLLFIDGSIASLAPDLDMFKVVTDVATHFAVTHGASIAKDLQMDQKQWELDLDGIKAGFGVDPADRNSLTYKELRERRALITKRLKSSKDAK